MLTTVVGSFPIELKKPQSTKDKILNIIGGYNHYNLAIEDAVINQLNAGIDIVSDGQVRGDMVTSFAKFIPGMKVEGTSTTIFSKIKPHYKPITTKDIAYAQKILKTHISQLPEETIQNKGVKGLITGPSTIVYSSRIESFYKSKNDAILDLASALKFEAESLEKQGVNYIQIDEPFLSTGMVNMTVAKKAMEIITKNLKIPIAMHVCGDLKEVFNDLTKFNIDILDCEFAGNNINIEVLEENANLLKGKKLGFGCLDTTLNQVDDKEKTIKLIERGINAIGKENIILDPDCGMRKLDKNIAFKKLELMVDIKNNI